MAIQTVTYIGVLANVDSSILKVKLRKDLKIESMSYDDLLKLFSALEDLPYRAVAQEWFLHFPYVYSPQSKTEIGAKSPSEMECYVVSNSFDADLEYDQCGRLTNPFTSNVSAFAQVVQNYLNPTIKLMRLYKEGNICKPLEYYFTVFDGKPKPVLGGRSPTDVVEELFTLRDEELQELEEFIHKTSLPSEGSFVDLAHKNFELSYQTHNVGLSFLSLMIAMEVLFNPGAHKVARNAAVLLGTSEKNSTEIFEEVKGLHDKRSQLLHSGKTSKVCREDVTRLRYFVRESIKRVMALGIQKEVLLEKLNRMGFGDGVNL